MTRFESRGSHESEEQWHARDMRVYTDLGFHEDETLSPMHIGVL
jgi:hypothetical protein